LFNRATRIRRVTDAARELADRLAERTLELVDVHSVSREEEEILELVRTLVPSPPLELAYDRDACLLYVTPRREGRPLVVLAGHVDTVPAQGNFPGSRDEEGVAGLGASDMKGGVAVMIELARWIVEDEPELHADAAFVIFGREELSMEDSPLPALFEAAERLREAQLAVVLEPTDCAIHAGSMGHLRALVVYEGEAAHSARPWTGRNAIAEAMRGLAPLLAHEPREVEIEGLQFTEVLSATQIHGGVATNVIPDRVEVTLSFRYPPDRTPEEAQQALDALLDGNGRIEDSSNSPSGRVVVDTPLVRRLRDAGDFDVAPKQAWTPVAEFTARGIDAVNLGPGHTRYAHTRDERVSAGSLVRVYTALQRFLRADP
jgi:succinyl-diaminopimelate desuccinylase